MNINPKNTVCIILNYKNPDFSCFCLNSLYTMPDKPKTIIIVDNNSGDESINIIQEYWEKLHKSPIQRSDGLNEPSDAVLLSLDVNNGYSAGNNVGIRLAMQGMDCSAIWLLNNDTKPMPGSLDFLCKEMNKESAIGIVGSSIFNWSDTSRVQCLGGATFNKFSGATKNLYEGLDPEEINDISQEKVNSQLSYVTGASMLVKRKVFEDIGLLPEEYFLYYEDVDFCISAHENDYKLSWAPKSEVIHYEGGSVKFVKKDKDENLKRERQPWVDYLSIRNRIYIVKKKYPLYLFSSFFSFILVLIFRVVRGQTGRIPFLFQALLDGLSGKMGKPHFLIRDKHFKG